VRQLVKRISREDLLDEIDSGAEVIRKPAFAPAPKPVETVRHIGISADEIKTMLAEHEACVIDAITAKLKAIPQLEAKPKRLHVRTYRNANDDLEADITVVE
jgi:hypothetical protein